MKIKRPLIILTAKALAKAKHLARFWRYHSQVEASFRQASSLYNPELNGKVIVITGSSKGVGFVLAQAFLRQGSRVILNGRNAKTLEQVRTSLAQAYSGQVVGVCADVSTSEGCRLLLSETLKAFGSVDILINNAGVAATSSVAAWEVTDEEWQQAIGVNLDGAFYASKTFISWMIENQVTGRVINVSSGAASMPVAKLLAYATSKSALETLTRNFAVDLKGTGVSMVAIELGSTQSSMTKNYFPLDSYLQLPPAEIHIPVFIYAATASSGALHGRVLASWRYQDKGREEAWLCSNIVYGGKLEIKPRQVPDGLKVEDIAFLELGENQLGMPPTVRQWLSSEAYQFDSNLYPDLFYSELRGALAKQLDLPEDALAFGNGSSELIERLLRIFTQPGDEIVSNDPSWFIFDRLCTIYSLDNRKVAFAAHQTRKYHHNLDGILAAVTERTRLIYLIHPSNPVGVPILREAFNSFLQKLPKHLPVIVDEAYIQYSDRDDQEILNTLAFIKKSEHPIIGLRTFSKIYGLAGMRVGFAFASAEMIRLLDKLELAFNISSFSAHAAYLALEDTQHVDAVYSNHKQQKQIIEDFLMAHNLDFIPTQSNMMLAQYPTPIADQFYAKLRENGVLVPPVNYFNQYFLWPIGLPEQNARIMQAIVELIL